jgi:hypothetical protein
MHNVNWKPHLPRLLRAMDVIQMVSLNLCELLLSVRIRMNPYSNLNACSEEAAFTLNGAIASGITVYAAPKKIQCDYMKVS